MLFTTDAAGQVWVDAELDDPVVAPEPPAVVTGVVADVVADCDGAAVPFELPPQPAASTIKATNPTSAVVRP